MNIIRLTLPLLFLAAHVPLLAGDQPLLVIPGKVIFESRLDAPLSSPWKANIGKWEVIDGVLRGSERTEDNHGAVARLPNKLPDFVIEYEFRLSGARSTSLSINAVKDHMARILVTPSSVTVQKDDNDHDGPDKAVIFARFPAKLAPGTWHKVRMEMAGDTMLGQVDDMTAWGSDPLFAKVRMAPGLTVAGQSVEFRNFRIREATPNPAWPKVRETLPRPGEKIAPPAGKTAPKKGTKKK